MKTNLLLILAMFFAVAITSCEKEDGLCDTKEMCWEDMECGWDKDEWDMDDKDIDWSDDERDTDGKEGCGCQGGKKGGKKGGRKGGKKFPLHKIPTCTDSTFINGNVTPGAYIEHIIDSVVIDPTCNCPVKGFVKYRSAADSSTVALVKYVGGEKDGMCKSFAVRISCVNGDCHPKNGADVCKVELDCTNQ